jgi:stress response protein YsnF
VVERGGVRVHKIVREHDQEIAESLLHEEVDVRTVPVNRFVDGPVDIRVEGDTTVIPILEEVLVVEKRLRLREELHIRKQRHESREPRHIRLRTEEAVVEPIEARPQDGPNGHGG